MAAGLYLYSLYLLLLEIDFPDKYKTIHWKQIKAATLPFMLIWYKRIKIPMKNSMKQIISSQEVSDTNEVLYFSKKTKFIPKMKE